MISEIGVDVGGRRKKITDFFWGKMETKNSVVD